MKDIIPRAKMGPLAKCEHCGVVPVGEAFACDMGDCHITNWHVKAELSRRPAEKENE